MLRVGLTGGIGSGKSTVAGRLVEQGAVVIDADCLAREVVGPGTEGLAAVVADFGAGVLTPGGELDRVLVAERVFGDDAARARLNGIVHPLVAARSAELIAAAADDAVIVQDIPLLVEGALAAGFPLVVVVHADAEVRVRRLVEQRGMPEPDARSRIAAQATDEQRRAVADVWLDNSGARDGTLAAVDRLWAERLVPFEENLRTLRRAPRPRHAELVLPDETWPAQAERMAARVAAVAGRRAWRVDHIGSTAVPGLAAKDVLDLQVVVHDLNTASQVADGLVAAGLVRGAGRWWDNALDGTRRNKAIALNADPGRAANCHIRPLDSPVWRETLLFRDWLRAHPDGLREYAEVKQALARQRLASIDVYAAAKTPFISSALARAERWAAQAGWKGSA
ncbi:MAG TPA: dephospho-CoA kinase [Pseudonocardiaceae bacterium]|nr:dephospho-CoA kinase [Pseudonocardiaceae bacterium]